MCSSSSLIIIINFFSYSIWFSINRIYKNAIAFLMMSHTSLVLVLTSLIQGDTFISSTLMVIIDPRPSYAGGGRWDCCGGGCSWLTCRDARASQIPSGLFLLVALLVVVATWWSPRLQHGWRHGISTATTLFLIFLHFRIWENCKYIRSHGYVVMIPLLSTRRRLDATADQSPEVIPESETTRRGGEKDDLCAGCAPSWHDLSLRK